MEDSDRFMPVVRWGLHILSMRADSHVIEPKWKEITHKALMMAVFALNLFCDFNGIYHCRGHLACTVDNVGTTTLQVLAIYMLLAFIKREPMAKWILDEIPRMMREFKTEEETRKTDRLCNSLSRMYTAYVCFGATLYCLYPPLDYHKCLKRDNTHSAYQCGE